MPTMDKPTPPHSETQALVHAMTGQLAQWQELKYQLQELHARLEYVRLMLRIHLRDAQGPVG